MENTASFIEKCWEKFGGKQSKTIDEWYDSAKETLPQEHGQTFNGWMLVYDEFLSWLISYNVIWYFTLAKKKEATSLQNCRMMIGAAVISLSISLRKLAMDGDDIAARHVMRCLQEYVDVLALLSINPDLCDEFISTQDEDAANAFWHKYVSKGKAQKEIIRHRKSIIDAKSVDEIDKWKRRESQSMAMASHPSYGACVSIFFAHSHDDPSQEIISPFYPLGAKTTACIRPISNAVVTLCEHIIDYPVIDIDESILNDELFKPVIDHMKNGIEVLARLLIYVIHK